MYIFRYLHTFVYTFVNIHLTCRHEYIYILQENTFSPQLPQLPLEYMNMCVMPPQLPLEYTYMCAVRVCARTRAGVGL